MNAVVDRTETRAKSAPAAATPPAVSPPQACPVEPAEVAKLRETVEYLDELSQRGFSDISTMTKLALSALETPDGHIHLETIVKVLNMIWTISDDMMNQINVEAENVGCNHVDTSLEKFYTARRLARG